MRQYWDARHRFAGWLSLALVAVLAIILIQSPSNAQDFDRPLPPPQARPLPSTLARWQDPQTSGDYFDQVQVTEVGYLSWSDFPVRIYLEPADQTRRSQAWVQAAYVAVQAWSTYLPLTTVSRPDRADITIQRSALPIRFSPDKKPSRVRSAETRYELYVQTDPATGQQILKHRSVVRVRPDQATDYIRAAVQHELGHALGIWGHSPNPQDVMYFAQVRQPPPISARDLNTLKRVYAQPTRLGWPLPN